MATVRELWFSYVTDAVEPVDVVQAIGRMYEKGWAYTRADQFSIRGVTTIYFEPRFNWKPKSKPIDVEWFEGQMVRSA